MNAFLIYFSIINILGFFIIWFDKKQAVSKKYRISEQTLLTIVALGGVFGSGLSMILFRHKISKTSFLIKFFAVVGFQLITLSFLKRY